MPQDDTRPPGYEGPMPPEKMKDILAFEKALFDLMSKVTFE